MESGEVAVTGYQHGKIKVLGEVTIFVRGDANRDYYINIADPVFILNSLFRGGPFTTCPDAADANDDGIVNISDPITILQTIFLPGTSIAQPYPRMGSDPTGDMLGPCEQ
jgi:hypothetical protein